MHVAVGLPGTNIARGSSACSGLLPFSLDDVIFFSFSGIPEQIVCFFVVDMIQFICSMIKLCGKTMLMLACS